MSAIGPELPPHLLAKRKREAEEAPPPTAKSPQNQNQTSDDDSSSKRRRVLGPALPPAPLDERPPSPTTSDTNARSDVSNASSGSSSDNDDDDFGPSLPPSNADILSAEASASFSDTNNTDELQQHADGQTKTKPQRDEWMIIPPKQDDLAARMDPSKIRARGFNTSKSAKGRAPGGVQENALWTETPEEKRKRLEEEMLGVREKGEAPSEMGSKELAKSEKRAREEADKARRIREYNEAHRASSLMEQHQSLSGERKVKEDDPNRRVFDYEKDMGGGVKIGHSARKQMLDKAAQFGSKFSGGGYL